ncbi:hypothetical protein [Niabella hibiscisoli]|uniref:hypothetical protein n=1 Tax=Niabella hibiscisoli TaxID=1825928 RepID=UPI001F0FD335|nr:hypothetical protein [Niabella hibiscisoli]MCH5718196.1 hypothetical protein [Niabella hibiscisoli]
MRYLQNSIGILIVAAFLLLYSCGITKKGSLSKEELLEYVNDPDNGLTKEQEANGVKVKLSFYPSSLLVAQEQADTIPIEKLKARYGGHYYFKARFSKDGKEAIRQLGDFGKYSEMVQVLAFRMNDYVNLTTSSKDTLSMADYFFDQTYGMSDGNNLMLVFSKDQIKNANMFDINIAECGFGTGALKFSLKRKTWNSCLS